MPSGIEENDGMAYVGQKPWHNLGVKVEGDAMTAVEAIEATGMDWQVEKVPLYYMRGGKAYGLDGVSTIVENKVATVRQDTQEVLGIVGHGYQPVQNVECFSFFDSVIGTGEAKYDTVGTLNNGKRVWLLAKFNESITLDNEEQIDSYVLLTNSHDGTSSLSMQWCDIRVVCQNTFEFAVNKKSAFARFKARHTTTVLDRASQAREILLLQNTYKSMLEQEINLIAEKAWNEDLMESMTYKLLNLDSEKSIGEQNGSQRANAETMVGLFKSGLGNNGKTAWHAYNAVTEYLSHYKGKGRAVNTIGDNSDAVVNARLNNNWFGDGVKMRNEAWKIVSASEEEREHLLLPA